MRMDEIISGELTTSEAQDRLCEIVDSSVPIYHADLLALALDDLSLALEQPECGRASNGEPTAINVIEDCVYERISNEVGDIINDVDAFQDCITELDNLLSEADERWEDIKQDTPEDDIDHAFDDFSDSLHDEISEIIRCSDIDDKYFSNEVHDMLNHRIIDFIADFER
jgi:hypothetical protein